MRRRNCTRHGWMRCATRRVEFDQTHGGVEWQVQFAPRPERRRASARSHDDTRYSPASIAFLSSTMRICLDGRIRKSAGALILGSTREPGGAAASVSGRFRSMRISSRSSIGGNVLHFSLFLFWTLHSSTRRLQSFPGGIPSCFEGCRLRASTATCGWRRNESARPGTPRPPASCRFRAWSAPRSSKA